MFNFNAFFLKKTIFQNKSLFNLGKKGLFNNSGDFGALLLSQRHNNLRVISTPTFPVPYYQRIMRNPPSPEQVTIDLRGLLEPLNEGAVIRTKHQLAATPEGLKILEYVENYVEENSYLTQVDSVGEQCDIYADDLIHFLDCAHEENVRILKSCDLADVFK